MQRSDSATTLADQIATTYGTKPRHHGRELRVFCPVHEADGGGHNPSLAVWDRGGGLAAFKCMTGCDQGAVRAALKARGIAVGSGPVSVEAQHAARHTKEQRRQEQLRQARDLLEASGEPTPLSRTGLYLDARGIHIHHFPSTLRECDDPQFPGGVAMLGVIADLRTMRAHFPTATGVTLLSLMEDGTPRLSPTGAKFRSIIGTYAGFGVPLGDPSACTLLVGEGIETTLAAMDMLDYPFGVAVLSASNIAGLVVPEWTTDVLIAADHDQPGLDGARALQTSLKVCGVRCDIERWGEEGSGWDAADELKKRREG